MLKITNFSKSYTANTKAVDGLNLEIEKGDIYGFIGHNGSGKTTTIKAVAGVHDFDEGEVLIDGVSIKKEPIKCKMKMAYIPDQPDIYDFMKGDKYLNFVADMYEVPLEKRKAAIEKYAGIFEIKDVLGNQIGSYSHGMRQKLALTAALIHDPKLLVLDEPFVGLDPKATFRLKEIMHDITDKGGAIFFSTHVLEQAEKLCTKIAIIKKGKLIVEGKTETVLKNKSLEQLFLELV